MTYVNRRLGRNFPFDFVCPNFGGRFLDFMDGVVAGSAVLPPVDLSLEAWKVAFASEVARGST